MKTTRHPILKMTLKEVEAFLVFIYFEEMSKTLHALLWASLLMLTLPSLAQSITDHGNRWTSATFFFIESPSAGAISIGLDTLVDDLIYRKVLSTGNPELDNWHFDSLLVREDNGKVYRRTAWTTNPEGELVMDFGLEVGDTFTFEDQLCTLEVIEVDSVQLENGVWKKRLFLEYLEPEVSVGETFVWIEGVGANYGQFRSLLSCGQTDTDSTYPICFHSDDDLIYSFPDFPYEFFVENCWYNIGTDIEALTSTSSIQLFPNPANEFIYLLDDEQQIKAVDIYDSAGKQVYSSRSGVKGKIEISGFVAGTYFVSLVTESGIYSTRILKL